MYVYCSSTNDTYRTNERSWRTYGSLFVSGILVVIIAFLLYLVKFFPPVVTGSVVTIIGINLMPVAMNYLAGGEGAKIMETLKFDFRWRDIGHHSNFTKVYERLLEINCYPHRSCIGTALAVFGLVDIKQVGSAHWVGLPLPFRFSGFGFDLSSTLVFFIVAVVSLIESTGVYHALSEITGKSLSERIFVKVTLRKV